ncbi:MAG: hypothetical protein ACXWIU_09035, partial [Limisphaerales bacterium]
RYETTFCRKPSGKMSCEHVTAPSVRENARKMGRKLAAMEVMKTVVVPKPASTENAFVAAAVPA